MIMLFDVAAWLFGINMVLSLVLFSQLRNETVCEQIFALPNSFIGSRPKYLSLYLLRVKYFFPWVKTPSEMLSQAGWVRVVFWLARVSGACFIIAIIAFFVSLFN